jgi:hypothetical protein
MLTERSRGLNGLCTKRDVVAGLCDHFADNHFIGTLEELRSHERQSVARTDSAQIPRRAIKRSYLIRRGDLAPSYAMIHCLLRTSTALLEDNGLQPGLI